jgi:dolichol-phosphate mannosyltransferase
MPVLSVVVPVYKEERNIGPFLDRVVPVLKAFGAYEVIFALDPSPDRTEEAILERRQKDDSVKLLRFSRRVGQPAATLAGIHFATGEATVVIDVDLQDPPELIREMVAKWREGYEVVYAQRRTRAGETLVKRIVSSVGYSVINKISEVEIPRNTGDFRLMSRRVVEALKKLKESHGFLRGLVALVGFRQTAILYDRDPRLSGAGNYNRYLGSLRIGFNGIVGFSRYPLHLISVLGLLISLLSFGVGATYTALRLLHIEVVWGKDPALLIGISFLSGVQLLSLGIMGEYVGRIYDEVKGRPLYLVDRAYGFENGVGIAREPEPEPEPEPEKATKS